MKMRSAAFVSFAAMLTLAAFSFEVRAQAVGASRGLPGDGSYTVTGKVVLPDGKPAVGARVDVSCDFTSRTSNVDVDGSYRVTGIPAGNCTVVARVQGFGPLTEHRQITRDTPYGQAIYVPLFIRANPLTMSPAFAGVPKPALDKYTAAIDKNDKGDSDAALKNLDEAIALHAQFASAWYQKGVIFRKKGQSDDAIVAFVKAIEIKPDYLEAKYGFGMAQFDKKNYAVSEAVFRDVLKERSDMSEAHLNLGISLFYLKKTDEAVAELKTAIGSRTGDKVALGHLYLGQIYVQQKKNAEAAAELEKYIELVPKAPNAERIKTAIADLKKQS